MNGIIDLELYTISIIRLNSAFEKLKNPDNISDVKEMFKESLNDLETLYSDIVSDLNQDEVNINEYYLFFQNGKKVFPKYIDALGEIENEELDEISSSLMKVFNNLNKIADAFPESKEMIE